MIRGGPHDLPRPRAILFDWDNTLVDTWPTIHNALKSTFEAMGRRPWTIEETRTKVRHSARTAFPALFGARSAEAMRLYHEAFERDHLLHLRARRGAGAILARDPGRGRGRDRAWRLAGTGDRPFRL